MKIKAFRKRVTRSAGGNMAVYVFLGAMGIFTALPIIYTIISAFKPINELFLYPPRFFVYHPTWDNFRNLVDIGADMLVPFERYVFNSLFTTVAGTVCYLAVAALAAFPLAKHTFPGKTLILQVVIWAILFRPEVTGIPQYTIITRLGLVDTYSSIILPALSGSFGVFLMRQFMVSVPDELIESAHIDGCGELRICFQIVLPITRPAILTLLIFTFQSMWNSTGVQYIFSENLKMLPVALQQISTAGIGRAGVASAVAVLLLIPPITTYILCQNSVIETMTHSGLKS